MHVKGKEIMFRNFGDIMMQIFIFLFLDNDVMMSPKRWIIPSSLFTCLFTALLLFTVHLHLLCLKPWIVRFTLFSVLQITLITGI